MFEVTFLGHQGWSFRCDATHVLVDPLLTSTFGHGGHVGHVYPPRELRLDAMPPVDAVLFTHEHEDHFDVPSIARLDRRIPIGLSHRTSVAPRRFLADLGFGNVWTFGAGDEVAIGDLRFSFFASDHVTSDNTDEWDVLPFLVRDARGDGSFFTLVDTEGVSDATFADLLGLVERPGIWCYTNNAQDWSFASTGPGAFAPERAVADSVQFVRLVLEQHAGLGHHWKAPAASVVAGGGFSYAGDRAWLNRRVFRADNERVVDTLRVLDPAAPFFAARPGQTFCMSGGELASTREAPFVSPAPHASWPDRSPAPEPAGFEAFAPLTGRYDLEPEEREELRAHLAELAQYLYGGDLFRALSSRSRSADGRSPTIALSLLFGRDRARWCLAYDPPSCSFVDVDVDPETGFLAAAELWATDLLGMLRIEFSPFAVCFGKMRTWHPEPETLVSFMQLFCKYTHPLRQPARTRALYARLAAREDGAVPLVRAAARPGARSIGPRRVDAAADDDDRADD